MDIDVLQAVEDPARLAALHNLALRDHTCQPAFDRLTRLAAQLVNAPVALVSLVDADRQFFKSCVGLAEPLATTRETPLSHSFCKYVVAAREPLIVQDARHHPLLHENPAIDDLHAVAYLGIPLITAQGHVLGSFCVIDHRPRWWSERDIALLNDLTASVITEIELRAEIAERVRAEAALTAAQAQLEQRVMERTGKLAQAMETLAGHLEEREMAEVQLRDSEERLRRLIDAAPVAIATSRGGLTLYANPAYLRIFGYTRPEEIIGASLLEQIAPHCRAEIIERNRRREAGEPEPTAYETTGLRKDGTLVPLSIKVGQIRLPEGVTTVVYATDTSERARTEQAIRDSEARFQLVSRATNDAVYDWNVVTSTIWWNEGICSLFGYNKAEVEPTMEWWTEHVHPADRDAVVASLHEVAHGQEQFWSHEYRFRRADGSYAAIFDRGSVLRDNTGTAQRMIGAMMDISERKRVETALRTTSERFRMVLTNAPILLFALDPEGRITLVEGTILQTMGLQPEHLVGRSFFDVYRHLPGAYLDGPEERDPVRRALAGEAHTSLDMIGDFTFETHWKPVFDEHGAVTSVIGVATDVTEQKRAETALRESESRYRALSEAASEGIVLYRDGIILEANQRIAEMLGYRLDELIGRFAFDMIEPVARARLESAPPDAGQPYEVMAQRKDGATFPVETVAKIGTYQGETVHVVVIRDISERKRAEAALHELEAREQAILQGSSDPITLKDREGRYLLVNPAAAALRGCSVQEMIGQIANEINTARGIPPAPAADRFVLETGQRHETETVVGEGPQAQIYSSVRTPYLDSAGNIQGVISISRNITDRKRNEEALRKSEATNRGLLDAIPDLLFRIDDAGVFLDYRSPRNMGLYAPPEAFLGRSVAEVLPAIAQQTLDNTARALATGQIQLFEYELRLDDEIHEFEARLAVCGPNEVLALVRDITERKRMERKLTAARDVYVTLVEEAPMLVWRTNTEGECTFVNKQWLEFTGVEPHQSLVLAWPAHIHPNDVPRVNEEWTRALQARQPLLIEYRLKRSDGPYRWMDTRVAPFFDEQGAFAGYIGIATDITDRKQQEQIKDDFLALASHELKTPLAALMGYIYLLQRWASRQSLGERVDQALLAMMTEANRLDRIVNDLLDVSRIQNSKLRLTLRPLDLNEVLPRLIDSLRLAIPDHRFALDMPGVAPVIIHGDLQRIEQIVTNLCTNAAKYSPPSMPVTVRLRVYNEHVALTVEDYGLGIPAADLPYIFDRFYQVQRPTRESRPGLGLGLFITHELVRQHGGTITVESVEHGGSSFTVLLPYTQHP